MILQIRKSLFTFLFLSSMLILLSGCAVASAIKKSGSDIQYELLLSGHTSGYTVLKQWTGRGDLITEDFTVNAYQWVIYSSNTPDSSNWQDGSGVLQITAYNDSTGSSSEVINTYRPNEVQYGMNGAGTYHLVIHSTNTRFIIRVQIQQGSDLVLKATPVVTETQYRDVVNDGLPLGINWAITGTLTSTAGITPTSSKTIQLVQIQNDIGHQIMETETVAESSSENPNQSSFKFLMQPIHDSGNYVYEVDYEMPDEPEGTVSCSFTITTVRATYITLDNPSTGMVGSDFIVTATLKDYLGDQPIAGAPLTLEFCPYGESDWTNWNTNLVTDESGEVRIDLGKNYELVFPQLGDWQIKASFSGGTYNDIDYQAVDCSPNCVSYDKGNAIVTLSLKAPPTV